MRLSVAEIEQRISDGYDLVNTQKYEEALTLADTFLRFDKKMMRSSWDMKTYCLFKMCKIDDAVAVLDKRLLFDPNDFRALFFKAYRLGQSGKYVEAIQASNRHIKISRQIGSSNRLSSAYNTRGLIYYFAKEYDKAIPFFRKALGYTTNKELVKSIRKNIDRCEKGEYIY